MPPAFLFPETEIPADLMQTESQQHQQQQQQQQQHQQQDVTDSNPLRRVLVGPISPVDDCNDKLEDSDIVEALNVINIEDQKIK